MPIGPWIPVIAAGVGGLLGGAKNRSQQRGQFEMDEAQRRREYDQDRASFEARVNRMDPIRNALRMLILQAYGLDAGDFGQEAVDFAKSIPRFPEFQQQQYRGGSGILNMIGDVLPALQYYNPSAGGAGVRPPSQPVRLGGQPASLPPRTNVPMIPTLPSRPVRLPRYGG